MFPETQYKLNVQERTFCCLVMAPRLGKQQPC